MNNVYIRRQNKPKQIMRRTFFAFFLAAMLPSLSRAQAYGGPQPLLTQTSQTEREAGKASCHISLEYPTNANAALEKAFRTTIVNALMEDCSLTHYAEDTEEATTPKTPTFDGELADASKALADQYMKSARAELDQMKQEGELTESDLMPYSYEAKVKKAYANPYYVTFSVETYIYIGGAHGMPLTVYYTFDRETGHHYTTEEIFPANVQSKLTQIVNRNLATTEVYKEGGLFDKSEFGGSYPLPENGMALTEKGIIFQYQAYEIAPYAAGMPSVTVPYAEVYAIMTEKGKKICNFRPKDFQTRAR